MLVGVVNTAVSVVVMFGLFNAAGIGYWGSSAAAQLVGGGVSFILNKRFTFRRPGVSWTEPLRFLFNAGLCYGIAYGIAEPAVFYALSGHSPRFCGNVALIFGMCLFTGLNYFGQRFFVFRTPRAEKNNGMI